MTTAGRLYERSGDWLYDIGLARKRGIVTVAPPLDLFASEPER